VGNPTLPPELDKEPLPPTAAPLYPIIDGSIDNIQDDHSEINGLLLEAEVPMYVEGSPPPCQFASSEESIFVPSSSALDEMNLSAQNLSVLPIDQRTPQTKKDVRETAMKLQDKINKQILKDTKIPVTPARLVTRPCLSSDWLVKNLKVVFPKPKDSSEQHKLLTCTPLSMTSDELKSEFQLINYVARRATQLKKVLDQTPLVPIREQSRTELLTETPLSTHLFRLCNISCPKMGRRDTKKVSLWFLPCE
jgi:hypothetical protein